MADVKYNKRVGSEDIKDELWYPWIVKEQLLCLIILQTIS